MKLPLILCSFLLACLALNSPAHAADMGGITGGGGGTTNPNPIGSSFIARAVGDSKFLLKAYLNEKENFWETVTKRNGYTDPDLKFLFDRQDKVFQYLDKAVIELSADAPCHDLYGNEVDGSVHAKHPGAICISTFTLGKKLNELNFEYEVPALILHEISHQMGADEKLAVELQTQAIYSLFKKSLLDMRVDYKLLQDHLRQISFELRMLKDSAGGDLSSHEVENIDTELLNIRDNLALGWKVHPMKYELRQAFEDQVIKLRIEYYYVCSVDPGLHPEVRSVCGDEYAKGFKNKTQTTVGEFIQNVYGVHGDEKTIVNKVTDKTVLEKEIQDISDVIDSTIKQIEILDNESFKIIY
jgi:hypothetical protein